MCRPYQCAHREAPAMTDTTLLTPAEVARLLGRGERQTRAAIISGQIPSVQFGSVRLVPRAALDDWLSTAGSWSPPNVTTASELTRRRASKRREKREARPGETYAQRLLRTK